MQGKVDYKHLLDRILKKINHQSEESDIKLTPLSSFSNNVYKVEVDSHGETSSNRIYLLKIFRQYLVQFTTKTVENDVVIVLAEQGEYPKVHYTDDKLRFQDFVVGQTPNTQTITQKQMFRIVQKLGHLVNIFKSYGEQKSKYFQTQREIQQMFLTFEAVAKECSQNHPDAYNICQEYTSKILDPKIRQHLKTIVPRQMVPSHNDCHFHNVIVAKDGELYLIDYEFFSPNYRGYDLGNFFNEYATDYVTFEIRQDLELNQDIKNKLILKYYETIDAKISFEEAKRQVQIGRLLSHLFWYFIGVKQVKDPKLTIDMQYYIRKRYEQFMKIYQKL